MANAVKAEGFNGFLTKNVSNSFYWYSGTAKTTISEYSTSSTSTSFTKYSTAYPVWVKEKVISGYTYQGNSISVVEPGTFPQFTHGWSSTSKSELSNSFLADYVDVYLNTTNIGYYFRVIRYDSVLKIGRRASTESTYSYTEYEPSYFKDNVVPKTIFALLVGAGGSGGGGGWGLPSVVGGGDGSGGAGGATALLAITLTSGAVYEFYAGQAGMNGQVASTGPSGEDTTFSKDGTLLVTVGGGEGGFKGEYSTDKATAKGGVVTKNKSASDYTVLMTANGGQGGGAQGYSQPGTLHEYVYNISGTYAVKSNSLTFPGYAGGAWKAGDNSFCAPGGASMLACGGDSGSDGSTSGSGGSLGSGGGGGRYHFNSTYAGLGGTGGHSVVMLFC